MSSGAAIGELGGTGRVVETMIPRRLDAAGVEPLALADRRRTGRHLDIRRDGRRRRRETPAGARGAH
jgi:hypothetical protein